MSTQHHAEPLEAEVDRLKLELDSLKLTHSAGLISIGNYLLARLEQLGVKSMFGVPGDFNLGFLDLVEDFPSIDWIGSCNELNAAYAADGYARINSRSLGVILTTFGVGELSAINGIAGAFSEMVPILHIVGVPTTVQQKTKPMLHHTLGDGRYLAYTKAAEQFTISQALLTDVNFAGYHIDRILIDCITKARPVYLTLPTDLVHEEIAADRLQIPLRPHFPINEPAVEDYVLDLICNQVKSADGNVVVLVDACTTRHDVRPEIKDFLLKTGFPVYAAPMGKTAIDESYERYGGIYLGSITHPNIKEAVESAKLIISVGALKSDFNSGNFSYNIPVERTIELHSDHTKVQYAHFPAIAMKHLIPKLAERLQPYRTSALKLPVPKFQADIPQEDSSVISHAWFWPRMSQFFKPKDVIITETGTSNFGMMDVPLPKDATLISQILWGSIGWSVGAAAGAALAARELGLGRVILFVGDGSMQLTVQEISVMIREGVNPIIFLLNNSGYVIERLIHGKHRHYNDIANWRWTELLDTLTDRVHPTKSYTVADKEGLNGLLTSSEFLAGNCIQLVEVTMDKLDAPRALKMQVELSAEGERQS